MILAWYITHCNLSLALDDVKCTKHLHALWVRYSITATTSKTMLKHRKSFTSNNSKSSLISAGWNVWEKSWLKSNCNDLFQTVEDTQSITEIPFFWTRFFYASYFLKTAFFLGNPKWNFFSRISWINLGKYCIIKFYIFMRLCKTPG